MHATQPYRGQLSPFLNFLDTLIAGVRRGWGPPPRRSTLRNLRPNRVLILESHLIGDQVLLLPLLEALAATYPDAEVHVLANPWLEDLVVPLPDRWVFHLCRIPWSSYDHRPRSWIALGVMVWSLRRLSFDLAIDVRGDIRNLMLLAATGATRRVGFGNISGGAGLLTDALASPAEGGHLTEGHRGVMKALGVSSKAYIPHLQPDSSQIAWAKDIIEEMGVFPGRTLGIHPGASQADRRMSERQLMDLVNGARLLGWHPLLFGGDREAHLLQAVRDSLEDPPPVFQVPLRQFLALCGQLGQIVTMDSGPAHIGAALGRRVIVIIPQDKILVSAPLVGEGTLVVVSYIGSIEDLVVEQVLEALGPYPRSWA